MDFLRILLKNEKQVARGVLEKKWILNIIEEPMKTTCEVVRLY